jgi:hypothetical protein
MDPVRSLTMLYGLLSDAVGYLNRSELKLGLAAFVVLVLVGAYLKRTDHRKFD